MLVANVYVSEGRNALRLRAFQARTQLDPHITICGRPAPATSSVHCQAD